MRVRDDFAARQEVVEFVNRARDAVVDQFGQVIHRVEVAHLIVDQVGDAANALRQVFGDALEAHVIAHHAAARRRLEEVEDFLALGDGVQRGREERAQVVEQEANRPVVIDDTGQFDHQHADDFGAVGRRLVARARAHQLLDRQRIAEVVAHAGNVVEAVGERHVVVPGVALADLLVIAVQIAHHRLKLVNRLAVERHDHAEHAVRAGVMRPQVDDQLIGLQAAVVGQVFDIDAQAHAAVERLFGGVAQARQVEVSRDT